MMRIAKQMPMRVQHTVSAGNVMSMLKGLQKLGPVNMSSCPDSSKGQLSVYGPDGHIVQMASVANSWQATDLEASRLSRGCKPLSCLHADDMASACQGPEGQGC